MKVTRLGRPVAKLTSGYGFSNLVPSAGSNSTGQVLTSNGSNGWYWSASAGSNFVTKNYGGLETLEAHGSTGATETIDIANGNWHSLTLTANCAVAVQGFTAAEGCSILVKVTQDGTGGWGITWDSDIEWAGEDQPNQTAGAVSWFILASDEGDGTIYGFPVGGSGSPSGAAGGDLSGTYPNPTVAKVNGVAVTGTPSSGQVITATSGTAATWQTPTSGGGHILLADGHPTPFAFNDLLQMDDGSDFMWSDP